MFVKKIHLYNFRNYYNLDLSFDEGLNVIMGENAQGKTNIIESIYLLATGTSPRASKDKEMIKMGSELGRVFAVVETDGGEVEVEMQLSRTTKKSARVNGLAIAKIGELIGSIRTIFFSPDEMSLIKDSPDFRRKFMDIDLSQLNRSYFYTLNKYNKILKQRNALLKQEDKKDVATTLQVWDEQLAREGAKLIIARKNFCDKLSTTARDVHKKIAQDENLSLSYYSTCEGSTEEEIADSIAVQLIENRDRDITLGYTSVGPQRDDIKISLNDVDLRLFGSQGQQRTATLSIKLAEIEMFEEMTGEKPILLLDDVLSELDPKRRNRLLEACKGGQTILTCTDFDDFKNIKCKVFKISNGEVIK